MEKYIFEKYAITIERKPDGTCSILFEPSVGKAFDKIGRKIYIVSSGKDMLYVGEANTSIKTRLKRGCSAFNHYKMTGKSLNGYKGYKWLDASSPLMLSVAIFHNADIKREDVEAIEAEIVYLIREHKGLWPIGQNEIHFKNIEGTEENAKSIYKAIK